MKFLVIIAVLIAVFYLLGVLSNWETNRRARKIIDSVDTNKIIKDVINKWHRK